MSVDERTRHEIHGRFEELLGPELAGAFMSYLPPVGWADVATKRDLDALERRFEATLHREIGGLRGELHEGLGGVGGELHREIGGLRGELHEGLGGLRGDLHREIGGLRTEMTDRVDRAIRLNVFTNLATMTTLTGLVLAVTQLG